jgi:general secretion pathway protein E/type IV pilus assembly protein PilB
VARLIDLGAEAWIVANALLAVVAQRLVRMLCIECAESYKLAEDHTDEDGLVLIEEGTELRRAKGCPTCHNTGYRGRVGIFELLELDDDLRELVKARAGKRELREAVRRTGLVPLREAGMEKVKTGITSLDEVVRVT